MSTSHRLPKQPFYKRLSIRQWKVTGVTAMTLVAVLAMGASSEAAVTRHTTVLADSSADAYSVNDITGAASRDTIREAIAKHENGATDATVFATVVIDGQTKIVSSDTAFTDVRSVLEAGNITLAKGDTVSPGLDATVDESTVITITSADSDVVTEDSDIDFNTVTKEDPTLDKGTTKVESEGAKGVMETVSLVSKTGDTVTSKNTLSSYVKTAPQDRVVLVGTKTKSSASTTSGGSSSSASLGVTTPASEMQSWAHDYLISNGYTENDFTALVFIISHESGWRVNATNASSGAYGLPQALPGSKMSSAGADWQTNYQTQIKWFIGYCNARYGGITAAYNHWIANGSY
ncbi:G5 domain-containing protein [Pseudoscardovia suis]|uniref:aggregation-promoting factor C-terminal-like domain-containing protein n=1 Tax=Pseudoscardovia suis TaxID=987063 RepID=UPI003F9ACC9B